MREVSPGASPSSVPAPALLAHTSSVPVSGNVLTSTLRGLGPLSHVTCGSRERKEELSALTVKPDPKGMEEPTCNGSRLPPPFHVPPRSPHTSTPRSTLPGMRALGPEPRVRPGTGGLARLHAVTLGPGPRGSTALWRPHPIGDTRGMEVGRRETGGLPALNTWALRV